MYALVYMIDTAILTFKSLGLHLQVATSVIFQ